VQPLQRWLDDLGFKNSTFFRAETVANYELFRFDEKVFTRIRNPSAGMTAAINAINWPLLRITVPSKAFAILPHFAIVAHEIGHAICERVNWDLSGFQPTEQLLIGRISARLSTTPLSAQSVGILQQIFISWFHELASDAFAALLTGPAIYFSLCDFFQLLNNGYGLCSTHPANDLRRTALSQELTNNASGESYADVFHRHTGKVLTENFNSGILVSTPNKVDIYNDLRSIVVDHTSAVIMSELHESMAFLIPTIYAQARGYLQNSAPHSIYSPAQYELDLSTHLEPMLGAIPPIEAPVAGTNAASEFATILNVGWATLLTKLGDFRVVPDGATDGDRLETLHSLLEKAVELSEVKRLWEATP
jgi:hypothetical protein